MIKYILWDIDGTLLDFDFAEEKSIRACFDHFKLGLCNDIMLEDYKKINSFYWKALERGKIRKKEVLEGRFVEFFEKYKIKTDIVEQFNEEYQKYLAYFVEFNPNAKKVVEHFKEKYRQFAATNGTKTAQDGKLEKSGLNKILEKIFISEEIGHEKPSREFFEKIFSYTKDYNTDSYVIIGDSLTSDIKGGIDSLIKTIWYNPKRKENNLGISPDKEISSLDQLIKIL